MKVEDNGGTPSHDTVSNQCEKIYQKMLPPSGIEVYLYGRNKYIENVAEMTFTSCNLTKLNNPIIN